MLPLSSLAPFLLLSLFKFLTISQSLQEQHQLPQPSLCHEKCGDLQIPFPFHLNKSCSSLSEFFQLSCLNSTSLFLNIGSESYRILELFSDGLLVDFPGSSSYCRQYNDLNSFDFLGNDHFGISADNVIGLYDCEDSSLCKTECETIDLPGCDGNESHGSPACCYPLSDHSLWHLDDKFSVFSKFGCRGFSSWVVQRGSNLGKRGVNLEWAVPRNSSKGVCATNGYIINATSIQGGVRCACQDGFTGDGFATGKGCIISCIKDRKEAYGVDCFKKRHSSKKIVVIAGVLAPLFIIASLIALYLLKRPVKPGTFDPAQKVEFHSSVSFRKASKTRLFTYHELEEATKAFDEGQKLVSGNNGTIYAGVLGDGSHIAVHKVDCENEKDLIQVLSQIESLSAILHRNIARFLGCCIDLAYTPLLVYEYPANGTLEDHLHQTGGQHVALDWYKRLSIAAETASVLAFLQYEMSPPIFHCDLKSGYIFIDNEFSSKLSGFGLLVSSQEEGLRVQKTDVYALGVVLLEMIAGSNCLDLPIALQKIRGGKLEEIVDPLLYYHEQPSYRREQIETVADLAMRCLLFGGDGKLGMYDVAKELVHIRRESSDGGSKRGPALEETFSNSSLLQMISMSPDSAYMPKH